MISTFAIALPAVLFIVDPIGVVPLFITMTAKDSAQKCRRMAWRATLAATLLLCFFAVFGHLIFKVFGVTLPAFRVAGGLLLLLTSLDMLRARPASTRTSPEETTEGAAREDIALVPLAMPLLAGPGAIATVMVLMAEHGRGLASSLVILASIVITGLLTWLTLSSAQRVRRVLGHSGIMVLERVFGLILAAIAVQFVFDGGRVLLSGR